MTSPTKWWPADFIACLFFMIFVFVEVFVTFISTGLGLQGFPGIWWMAITSCGVSVTS